MDETEAKEVGLEMSQDYSSFLQVDFSKEVGTRTVTPTVYTLMGLFSCPPLDEVEKSLVEVKLNGIWHH